MKKRHTDDPSTGGGTRDEEIAEQSVLNPAGAARRRLARALGGTGTAVLAVLSASGWKTPVVRGAVLPAHAGATPSDDPQGCVVSLAVTIGGDVCGGDLAASVLLGNGDTTTLASASTEDSGCMTLTVSGSTFTTGASDIVQFVHFIGVSLVADAQSAFPNVTWSLACCDHAEAGTFSPPESTAMLMFPFVVNDDECIFPDLQD